MFSPATLTKLASFAMLLAVVNDKALAAPGTSTRRSRYNLSARNNVAVQINQCGALLPNVPVVGNECVCFDPIPSNGPQHDYTPAFASTPAALKYAKDNNIDYPEDVAVPQNCTFPGGGPFTLLKREPPRNNCCGYKCDIAECGAFCLKEGEQCQSGMPVPKKHNLKGQECDHGLTSCAVAFTGGQQAYECLDISKDLESCGGCMNPDPRYGKNSTSTGKFGQDCSAIAHAADVACIHGKCVVAACDKKYKLFNGTCTDLE